MLDIKFIRENPSLIEKGIRSKKCNVDISHVLHLDKEYRERQQKVQLFREERNKFAKERNIEEGKRIKDVLEKEEHALNSLEKELHEWLLKLPNLPKPDVPAGEDESKNKVVRKHKEPTKFNFQPKDHLTLGESLDLIDMQRAAKVSGARFGYLKNDAVLVEFALIQLALETLLKEKFIPIIPPDLIKQQTMAGLGYMENGGAEDMFLTAKDDLVLTGTAEHALVPMHMNEVFNVKDLPRRYVGFSNAYRREAGSYGKDTRGIFRVHQFDKVEMVSYVAEGNDDKEHEYLLGLEEKLFQALDIPYQVVQMCTGDLGFPAARKYDIEAWIPSQNKYREVTSVSTVTDFQSRRLNIRYQDGSEKKYANILNGTAFAIGRTLVAILENYQQEDGSVVIPQVLQNHIGKSVIKAQ